MAREKQYVFSARTTEEGLKLLNHLKAEKGIGWDEVVIDAVSAHYGLDKAVMTLPKREKPAKEEQNSEQQVPAEETTSEEHPAEAGQEKPLEEPAKKRKGKAK